MRTLYIRMGRLAASPLSSLFLSPSPLTCAHSCAECSAYDCPHQHPCGTARWPKHRP